MFAGEVLVVLVILVAHPPDGRHRRRRHGCGSTSSAPRCRPSGWASSCSGSSARASGASSSPKPTAPEWLGLSPVDLAHARRRRRAVALPRLGEPAARTRRRAARRSRRCFDNRVLRGGLTSFFFQYLLQAGLFFAVPAVPVGGARAVGDRDRRPAAPAVDHAAARRGRHPQGLPARVAPPRRPARLPRAVRRASS